METDQTTETGASTETGAGEGESSAELISIPKADWEKSQQTIGSMKREIKDLKKPKETASETQQTKTEDSVLLQKLERMSLKQAGITHEDDVELAKKTAKKWGVDIDDVLADEDFKAKLERQQTTRDNAVATSNIKGGAGTQSAKNSPEYWIAKGTPPSPTEVPDRVTRQKIAAAFLKNSKNGSNKKFYND